MVQFVAAKVSKNVRARPNDAHFSSKNIHQLREFVDTDFSRYELDHLRRLEVTPGLTGLWQVTARREPSFEKNVELDLEYINNWSLLLDVRILLRTVIEVLRGSGR